MTQRQILQDAEITQRIRSHVQRSSRVWIAAPFWGEQSIARLGLVRRPKHKDFQLICNLDSGACNPEPISELMQRKWRAFTNRQLHAKLYLFDNFAIVGSANPSANGLALQDTEITGWYELCLETDDPAQIEKLRMWFKRMKSRKLGTEVVTQPKLKLAQKLWDESRNRKANAEIKKRKKISAALKSNVRKLVLNRTMVWIYSQFDVDKETTEHSRAVSKELKLNLSSPYQVETDPRKADYKSVIDCFLERKGKKISVFPRTYDLLPDLSKRIASGAWALPCRATKPNLVDPKLRSQIRKRISEIQPVKGADWTVTLRSLLEDRLDGKKKFILQRPKG